MSIRFYTVVVALMIMGACDKKKKQEEAIGLPNKIMVNIDTTIITLEPDRALYVALRNFVDENKEECAKAIRTATLYMKPLAARAEADAGRKQEIERAISELEELADKISLNEVKDVGTLNSVFGETGQALAEYRLWFIEYEFVTRSLYESGVQLEKTIRHLEQSINTHYRTLDNSEKSVLDHGLDVAYKLKEGQKVDRAELRNTVASIDEVIDRWSKEFEMTM